MKKTEPEYYPPVENLLDLSYDHYMKNNSVAPQTTDASKEEKKKRERSGKMN